jgi:flagellar hook protein FlgE
MSPANSNASPEATTKAYVNGVLDKEDTNLNSDDGYVMTLGIYDSLGYNYTAKFAVKPTDSTAADGTQYHISLTDIVDSTGTSIITGTDEQKAATLQRIWGGTTDGYDMTFDTNNGSFVSIGTGTDGEVPTSQLLNLAEGLGTGYTTNNGDGTTTTSNFANVEVDFSSAINKANGGKSSLRMERGDSSGDGTGKKLGAMIGLTVDNSGKIYGSYDNGNTELLGQIAVAQFANASGLEKIGSNC